MLKILFLVLAVISVISALGMVFFKNPVHGVLSLIVTFFSIAGHFILLNAQFLAIVQVIVYAGAIMVLFLFVVMLLNLNQEIESHKPTLIKISGAISAGSILLILLATFKNVEAIEGAPNIVPEAGLVKTLGKTLFTEYLVPFEASSVLFLSAMVGAVLLGKKDNKQVNG